MASSAVATFPQNKKIVKTKETQDRAMSKPFAEYGSRLAWQGGPDKGGDPPLDIEQPACMPAACLL
jgi:hypothetical protein